jgi:hypothetical protein
VLAEQLDVLLGHTASLVDSLAALSSALCELLGLVLNLCVQAVEDGEDGAFKFLCGREMLVGDSLKLLLEDASLQLEMDTRT